MRFALLCLVFQATSISIFAQTFDPSFGTILKGAGMITTVAEAPDGNFLAAGMIDYVDGEVFGSVLKLDHSGKFMDDFNKVYTDKGVGKIMTTLDGKILILGAFTKVNGNPARHLARLNSDGSFDASFTADNSIPIEGFELQSDGKIIVLSKFNLWPCVIHRLLPNGELDTTFNEYIVPPTVGTIFQSAIDGTDRIVLSTPSKVLRLQSNGELDTSFSLTAGPDDGQIHSLAAQPDGKILLGGTFQSFFNIQKKGLIRLNEDGTLDNGFTAFPDYGDVGKIKVLKSGSILASVQGAIFKFPPSGNSRKTIAYLTYFQASDITETSTNQLLIGGDFSHIQGVKQDALALLNEDYTVNTTFAPNVSSAPRFGRDMTISKGGKILLSGFNSYYAGLEKATMTLFQVKPDGTLDDSFSCALDSNSFVTTTELQHDKKILVSGRLFIGSKLKYLVRLNADGSYDPEFNSGNGPNGSVYKIRFNGADIFLSGAFTTYNDLPTQGLVCLDHKGVVKRTYNELPIGSGIGNFDFQSDGKIIAVGTIQTSDGEKGLVRLNRDGTLDETFRSLGRDNYSSIKVDAEDRIYVGGYLRYAPLLRLLPDGELDRDFMHGFYLSLNENTGPKIVYLIDILPNNKIIVGGNFDFYKDMQANGMIIFDKDGPGFTTVPELNRSSLVTRMTYHGSHVYVGGRLVLDGGKKIIGLGKIKLNTTEFAVPAMPKEFRFRPAGNENLTVEWYDNTDAEDGYEVERFNNDTQAFEPIEETLSSYTALIDNTEDATIQSNYRIRSFNAAGKSDYQYIKAYVAPHLPAAPANLSVAADANNKLVLSWTDDSDNEDGFIIQKSTDENSGFTQIAKIGEDRVSYEIAIAPKQTTYYRVIAYNDQGTSDFTATTFTYVVVTGVESHERSSLQFFPNPTSGIVHVKTDLNPQKIFLLSPLGQTIPIDYTVELGGLSIDASAVQRGLYKLVMQTSKGVQTASLIKD